MELYLLKSTIALSVLCAFFWLFLRYETYFLWNRIYLIVSMLISIIFPIISTNLFKSVLLPISFISSPIIINSFGYTNATADKESLSILLIIYISGAVFFSLRFLSRLSQIYYLYHRFPKIEYNGFKAVILDVDHSPFTFFSILFLSRNDYVDGKLSEMIVHEQTHRDQFHSIDILLLEIMTIIQWFNPFLWLFRIAIKSEHEFIADAKVLKEGFDKVTYQKLLVEKILGVSVLGVTNNFNYSLLKNRIKMMTNKKSSSTAIVKYLLSLPLLASICLFLSTNLKVIGQEKVYDVVDKMPQYGNSNNDLRQDVTKNMKYPESAAELGVQGRVYLQFIVSDKGKVNDVKVIRIDIKDKDKDGKIVEKEYKPTGNAKIDQAYKDLENESIRVMSLLGDFTPGEEKGKKVNVQYTFPITFILQ